MAACRVGRGEIGICALMDSGHFLTPGRFGDRWCAYGLARSTRGAALIRQVSDKLVHDWVVGAVDDLATGANLGDEPSALQGLEMKREGGGHKPDSFADCSGGKSCRPLLDEQPVDRKSVFVGERSERFDDLGSLHGGVRYFGNSRNVNPR